MYCLFSILKNENFGEIRTVIHHNEPWFVASDIAKLLGYRMASDITRNLDLDEMGTHGVSTPGGIQHRTVIINNDVWFVGKEIAEALGYANQRNAVPKHVDEEDRLCTQIEYAGQMRDITVINESGLYSLVLSSKLPNAKKFKRWVTMKGEL